MSLERVETSGDPTEPIGRWVLNACAKVDRESPEQATHLGLLMTDPEIGKPLVVAVDDEHQVTTSSVQRTEPGPKGSLYVYTRNSLYWIRRLSQRGTAE